MMRENPRNAMNLIASIAPKLSRRLEELNFSAYFMGSQIWVKSNTDPEVDMPIDLFCTNVMSLCGSA